MPKMPLVDTTPSDEQAIEGYTNGHVVDPAQPQKQMIVVQVEDTEATKNVSKYIDIIRRVSNNLLAIANVDKNISNVNKVVDLKDEMNSVLDVKESIKKLAVISNELDTLALNMHAIQEISNDIDTFIALHNDQEEYHFLWGIREHIVGLNESKDKLLMLLANMKNIDINAKGIAKINLVALHMLAVEIVAQNIDLLKFFNNHTELFKKTVEMYPALQEFIKYVDIAQELINIVANLPETLEQFKGDINNLANEMKEKFKALADDRLEQMEKAYDKFMSESLRLRESILNVDKALTDFKLKSMEEYTVLRESIAGVKQDLAKSKEQIEGNINEVEKNILIKVNKLELDFNANLNKSEKNTAEKICKIEQDLAKIKCELKNSILAELKLEGAKQVQTTAVTTGVRESYNYNDWGIIGNGDTINWGVIGNANNNWGIIGNGDAINLEIIGNGNTKSNWEIIGSQTANTNKDIKITKSNTDEDEDDVIIID